jgi:hypothetical protein
MAVILVYLGLITLGLRWNTLPADVEFAQHLVVTGAKFASSVLSHLCKKQWSAYTDNTPTYPRPPRTVFPPAEETQNITDSSDEEDEDEDEESEGQSEEEKGDKSSVEEKNE